MTKRILIYCDDFYPNNTGYANAFLGLIEAILEQNQDVFIELQTPIPLGANTELMIENLHIVRLRMLSIPKVGYVLHSIYVALSINKFFVSRKFDLLFIETFDNVFLLSFLSNKVCSNTLVRIHSTSDTEYTFFSNEMKFKIRKFLITKFIAKKIKYYASTNSYHIDFVKKYYLNGNQINIGDKIFFLIPNTMKLPTTLYDRHNNNSDKLKLMMLGRMDNLGFNQKGFMDFLLAINLLSELEMQQIEITIVGRGEKLKMVKRFTNSVENVKIIEYLSHEDCLSLLNNIDAVVLPSRYEGLSMLALESIALGKVCLFSRVGGLIDLIDKNGLLFEPQSFEDLSAAIKALINMKKMEIHEMKEQSKLIYRTKFSPTAVAERFDFALQTISHLK